MSTKKHQKLPHGNIFLKTLAAKLSKTSRKKLENNGIVLSPHLEDISEVEMRFLLNNLISAEDFAKIRRLEESFTSLGSGAKPYYEIKWNQAESLEAKARVNPSRKEVEVYLKKFEEDTYLKRFSSTNVLLRDQGTQMSFENVKNIERTEKKIQEQKSEMSLKAKGSEDRGYDQSYEKHRSTLKRIQRKMELMKKYCPEIYFSEESVISMWTRGVKYN